MSTKHMDYWNHILWSDEMKIICLGLMASSVCGGDQVRSTKKCVMPTVKQGDGNVMVKGCMSAKGVGELYFIEGNMTSNMYCEILQQSMIPSLQKMGRRAVFQHDNDSKHTSKTTITLLKRLRVKLAKYICRFEPNRTSLGDPQAECGGVQSLKYLPVPRRCHGGVEEHSSGYLWSSSKLHAQERKGSSW